jgi:hypothetical protein
MFKQSWMMILALVVLSVMSSLCTILVLNHHNGLASSDVLRVKRIELVDAKGRVGGILELESNRPGEPTTRLTLRGPNGRDSIVMNVNSKGDGTISFSNPFWNEGAVTLGHLLNSDDGADKNGAWGLRIRSADGRYTGIGFFDSGAPIVPSVYANDKITKGKNPNSKQ